ncbi:MAG: cyclase [Chloroflexi bacterium]|nr:cyclase [Chloroflexota bacterium]
MNLHQSICQLLRDVGPGQVSQSPYDTAWVARLSELGEPHGESALEWLRQHQLADGSWGAPQPTYYHDRLICTLAAMTALARYGKPQDRTRWQRAQMALNVISKGLQADPAGATVGFEMIAPTLMSEAIQLGILPAENDGILADLTRYRALKLARLPGGMVNRFVSTAFSAEMAGPDGQHLLDIDNLQESNGSIGHSPSATAYFAIHVRREDQRALEYLRATANEGAVPAFAPFDVFERAWTLWNLSLIRPLDPEILALCQPHAEFLKNAWRPGKGVGFSTGYSANDGDDTGLVFEVLARYCCQMDLDAIKSYEESDWFRCYPIESNPSISANIHILGALREAGLGIDDSRVFKIVLFLRRVQTMKLFWFDKWHTSPYYSTAHAIMNVVGLDDTTLEDAVYWILETQNPDGSWGYYMPTAEETAYCLQALAIWKRHGHTVPESALKRGATWLADHADPPYPPLWIVKCLYSPIHLVRSAILSALMLVEQG